MRSIGTLSDESQAFLLKDHLLAHAIACDIEANRYGEYEIWVHNETQLDAATAMLDAFRNNPDAPDFAKARELAAERIAEEEEAQRRYEQNMVDVGRTHRRGRLGSSPVTFILIGISAIVFANDAFGIIPNLRDMLFFLPLDQLSEYRFFPPATEIYRMITPIFLHFGLMHILFNMLWLRDFGVQIEFRRGSLYLLLLVVILGIASNFGQNFLGTPRFGGMSGVNYGLFGYIWMRSWRDPASGFFIHKTDTVILVGWFFFCFISGMNIANAAHAVGLVLGIIWGLLDNYRLGAKPR